MLDLVDKWPAAWVLTLLLAATAASDIDTQFIFGFTQGSDVRELGREGVLRGGFTPVKDRDCDPEKLRHDSRVIPANM
jgi:hypothetical protein